MAQVGIPAHERKDELDEKRQGDGHSVPVVAKYREEQSNFQERRESLSAYFTIAAAAFGLISDGCEYWAVVTENFSFNLHSL